MKNDELLKTAKIIDWLPHLFGRNETVPEELSGATIVRMGTFKDTSLVETGGLIVDYRPAGSDNDWRLVLAFNDTAMWTAANFQI